MNVRRKIWRRVCIEGFMCHGGQLEANSVVNRWPVKRLGVG